MILRLEGRKFLVDTDAGGAVTRICEEKIYEPGRPWERIYRLTRWKRGTNPVPGRRSLYRRVMEAVGEAHG